MIHRGAGLAVPVGELDHWQGNGQATVTLVEYGDFECSFCASAYRVVKAVQDEVWPDLKFVFRNFPLSELHPLAQRAAEAAEAAAAQGKFWEMHDALYENQRHLTQALIVEIAASLSLDMVIWFAQVQGNTFQGRVMQDFAGGMKSGVTGTPFFFINSVPYDGSADRASLMAAIAGAAEADRIPPESQEVLT